MFNIILVFHGIVCLLLIIIILIQRGRGGGLVESFSGLDSMFGTKTNALLTRVTTVLAILFLCTCLILAVMSAKQGKSLMRRTISQEAKSQEDVQPAAGSEESYVPEQVPEETQPVPQPQNQSTEQSQTDAQPKPETDKAE